MVALALKENRALVVNKEHNMSKLTESGGHWLRIIRSFMQSKFQNGSRVTWGSEELLDNTNITVRELEMIAERIAESAAKDYDELVEENNRLRKENFLLHAKLSDMKEQERLSNETI